MDSDSDDEYQSPAVSQFSNSVRLVVYITQVLDTTGLTMFAPLFPYYFKRLQGYDSAQDGLLFGLITSSFALGRFFGNTVLGVASDKYGRRKIILFGTFLTAGLAVWTAFAPSIFQLSLSRFIAGFTAGTSGALASYIGDVTNVEDRPKEMGRIGACNMLGIMAGPSLGIVFGYTLGVEKGFFVAALVAAGAGAVNFLAVLFFMKESPRFLNLDDRSKLKARRICIRKSKMRPGQFKSLMAIFLATFFNAFAFIFLETIMPLLLINVYHFVAWKLIIIFALFLIAGVLLQLLLFSRLMHWLYDIRNVVTLLSFIGATFIFVVPVVDDFYYILFIVSLGCSVCIMIGPAFTVMATYLSNGKFGQVLGMRSSVASLARAVSPLVNGPAYDVKFWPIYPSKTTHILPFIICSISLILAGLVIRIANRSHASQAQIVPPSEVSPLISPAITSSLAPSPAQAPVVKLIN